MFFIERNERELQGESNESRTFLYEQCGFD